MSNFDKILKSFSVKDTLNPKVWENPKNPDEATMLPKVRKALLRISEEFIDYLGDEVFVDDIVLTGSLANFNWSEYSDFDLHIIIDFEQYDEDAELFKELYSFKKQIFNDKHDIKIFGFDVEVYAQDIEESHYASGVYSILNDEWVSEPKEFEDDVDRELLKTKIKSWTSKIDKVLEKSEKKDLEKIKEKIKEYRKCGLEKDGEMSYENLVFKYLRRSGHIQKLFDTVNKLTDKELSIENQLKEQIENEQNQYKKIVDNSSFLKSLKEICESGNSFKYTSGVKIPYSEDVKVIQTALQFLGYSLPKWGVDGKFGPETQKATNEFQSKNNLSETGVINEKELKTMLSLLVLEGFKDTDLSRINFEKEGKQGQFSYLNLNTDEGYQAYKEICQRFIDSRNPNAGVNGDMMASCAKKYFNQGYVPPELALAQLALEGGLSTNPNSKPIRTKNPFNVGNTDSGKVNQRNSVSDGVCIYYDLMTRKYLTGKVRAEDLLSNFVNINNQRYATAEYEPKLRKLVSNIQKISEPIMANKGLSNSDLT